MTAPRGEDIVCAGISSLAQGALLGLLKHLTRQVDYVVKPGYLTATLKETPDELTEAILRTMVLGFGAIVDAYPTAAQMTMIHEG